MPCFGTTDRTRDNASKSGRAAGRDLPSRSDIGDAVSVALCMDIGHDHGDALPSPMKTARPRERTQVLMDIANKNGGLVIGTGDLSELALGWCHL